MPDNAEEGEGPCSAVEEFIVGCRLRFVHVFDGFKKEVY